MPLVTVKNKYQVVIPANVRKAAGIEVGDILEASIANGKVTFTPESLEDLRKDRVHGPFDTAEEMVASLQGKLGKKQRILKSKR